MSVGAQTITRLRAEYSRQYRVPQDTLASFGADVAHAMMRSLKAGKSPAEAYKIIMNGLYAEARAIAANRSRGRKRTSRRAKRTSREKRSSR